MNRTGKIIVGIAGASVLAVLSGAAVEIFANSGPKSVAIVYEQGTDVSFLPAAKTAFEEIKPDVFIEGKPAEFSNKSAVQGVADQIRDAINKQGEPALICAITPGYVPSNGYFGSMIVGVISIGPGAAPLAVAEAVALHKKIGGFTTCVAVPSGTESNNQDLLYLGFKQAKDGTFYLPPAVLNAPKPRFSIMGFPIG